MSVFKDLLSTSFPMLMSSFMLLLMLWIDVFILKMNVGFNEVGTYGTIVKFASINTIILYSVNSIAAPNMWGPIGGHCKKDETPYECCLREAKEETGYLPPKINWLKNIFLSEDKDNNHIEHYL